MFGQFTSVTQFFLYGKHHFTRSGWEKHKRSRRCGGSRSHASAYDPDLLEGRLNLSEHVFIVTGANSGIGKEVTRYLAQQGSTVYMICRSSTKAESAREEIVSATSNSKVHVLIADLCLESDVRRCWQEFTQHRQSDDQIVRLDALICNAGVLLNDKTLTADGIECTFATHLLFGTYLLGCLAMPVLECTPDSRIVAVSSGGMYTTRFPDWASATSACAASYSGNLAYAYAKRGQVLLMERWALEHPQVKCVSCHPGWVDTPGVEAAYGTKKKYLRPLRTIWQGTEGIIWLCVAPSAALETGAFYLDRMPQVKHMAGPFFSQGRFTKNSTMEIDDMIVRLGEMSHEVLAPSQKSPVPSVPSQGLLDAMDISIDLNRFMGRWYVLAHIPTFLDKDSINNTEDYVWDSTRNLVQITYSFAKAEKSEKRVETSQRGTIKNQTKTRWSVRPKFGVYLPLNLPYLVIYCAEDYSTSIIAVPNRKHLWILARTPQIIDSDLQALLDRAEASGYDLQNVVRIPQTWD